MGRASARTTPGTASDDVDARLAAIAGRMEQLLAAPAGLCEKAALELVNLSEQVACLRVAYEDDRADEFAITTAYAAGELRGRARGLAEGLAEGERRARQRPARTQDGQAVIRLLPGGRSEAPRRVSAATIVRAAALAAGTASTATATAIPVPE